MQAQEDATSKWNQFSEGHSFSKFISSEDLTAISLGITVIGFIACLGVTGLGSSTSEESFLLSYSLKSKNSAVPFCFSGLSAE